MARKKVVSIRKGTKKEPLEVIQQGLTIHQRHADNTANKAQEVATRAQEVADVALEFAHMVGIHGEELDRVLEHVATGRPVQQKQIDIVIKIISTLKKAGIMVIDAHLVIKQLRESRK